MKRLLLLMAVGALFLSAQLVINCASPLEPLDDNDGPTPNPPPADTIYLTDTIIVIDSTGEYDTIIIVDTIITVDTVWNGDTLIVYDTVVDYDTIVVIDTTVAWDTIIVVDTTVQYDTTVIVDTILVPDTIIQTDTIIQIDTIAVPDTIYVPDTIIWIDTVIQHDTIQVPDTIFVPDTIIQVDTVEVPDTVYVPDTIYLPDTVIVTDTIWLTDTVYVVVPDTGGPVMCGQMGAIQKEIVWMLRNAEGNYHLEFSGRVEKEHPSNTVIIDIDGVQYRWDVSAEPVFVIDTWLEANATILIDRIKPNPFGHSIDICLSISEL